MAKPKRRRSEPKPALQPVRRTCVAELVGPAGLLLVVTLLKGDQRWMFRYGPEDAPGAIQAVRDLAQGEDSPLDWLDVALVTHEIRKKSFAMGVMKQSA